MKSVILSVLVLLVLGVSVVARPVSGVTDGSVISIVKCNVKVQPPAGWKMVSAREHEAANYCFPWFRSKAGRMEFAFCSSVKKQSASLENGVKEHLKRSKLTKSGDVLYLSLSKGGKVARVAFSEGVVRFYFLSKSGRAAFVHCLAGGDVSLLEKVVLETLQLK